MVMAGPAWRTSSYSGASNCVEVLPLTLAVLVRDSRNPGPVLAFTRGQWAAFTASLRGT